MKIKLGFITGARSEYGIARSFLKNIDNDIKGLETRIQELKNKNNSDSKDQSSFNNKFLIKQSTIVDALESLNKKGANIESNISRLNIL